MLHELLTCGKQQVRRTTSDDDE